MDGKKYVIPTSAIYSIAMENGTNLFYSSNLNTSEKDSLNCLCGEMDAKKYHGKKRIHVALGIVLGPYAMIGTAIASPIDILVIEQQPCQKTKNCSAIQPTLNVIRKKQDVNFQRLIIFSVCSISIFWV